MRHYRSAFSFTEVLFAVMILGVGFIMVAAIFPVAIQQAKNTSEEGTGAAVSRGGANYFEKIANNATMPPTLGYVVSPDWDPQTDKVSVSSAMRGGLVLQTDSRVAWMPFYKRYGDPNNPSTWSPYAQVFMIPVYVRSASEYTQAPLIVQKTTPRKDLGLPIILATFRDGQSGNPDTVTLTGDRGAAVEGAYLIIANAEKTSPPRWNAVVAPDLNGRIYRLGNRSAAAGAAGSASAWELMPGFDFEPQRYDLDGDAGTTNHPDTQVKDGKEYWVGGAPPGITFETLTDVFVFVVGRGMAPEGTAQDVGAYTTFVNVN
jgi:hypothetical protein